MHMYNPYLPEIFWILACISFMTHLRNSWNECVDDIKYNINIICEMISHFRATWFSNIKHVLMLIYYRLTVPLPKKSPEKLVGKNVIIFVHGWYGSPTSVAPFINFLSE